MRDRRAEVLARAAAQAEARALLRAGLREDVARYPHLRGGVPAATIEAVDAFVVALEQGDDQGVDQGDEAPDA